MWSKAFGWIGGTAWAAFLCLIFREMQQPGASILVLVLLSVISYVASRRQAIYNKHFLISLFSVLFLFLFL
jgi:hypothetical protein